MRSCDLRLFSVQPEQMGKKNLSLKERIRGGEKDRHRKTSDCRNNSRLQIQNIALCLRLVLNY